MIGCSYEEASWSEDRFLMAFDEAGYGCIAGSMFVAGVVFPKGYDFSRLGKINDSKKLSESRRFELEGLIRAECLWSFCGEVNASEIDAGSPYYLRFQTAENGASLWGTISQTDVWMDGDVSLKLPAARSSQYLIGGDSKCVSIAAASILAKTAKDRQMRTLHEDFPMFGWNSNKGYESSGHRAAILKYGLSVHHRRSYCKKYIGETCT